MKKIITSFLLITAFFNALAADTATSSPAASTPSVAAQPAVISPENAIRTQLGLSFPEVRVDAVEKSIGGLYQVISGTRIFYVTKDARYLIIGNINDLKNSAPLTYLERNKLRKQALSKLTDKQTILYQAKKEIHLVTVFTDLDCGHCRMMHADTQVLNDKGISIRYIAFPRAGVGSESYKKAQSVWCASKPQEAMDAAMKGKEMPVVACEDIVKADIQLGEDFDLQGTPTCVFEDGSIFPGYVGANEVVSVAQKINEKMGRVAPVPAAVKEDKANATAPSTNAQDQVKKDVDSKAVVK